MKLRQVIIVLTGFLSVACSEGAPQSSYSEDLNRLDELMYWWVESAICDIRGAVKDNASMCSGYLDKLRNFYKTFNTSCNL